MGGVGFLTRRGSHGDPAIRDRLAYQTGLWPLPLVGWQVNPLSEVAFEFSQASVETQSDQLQFLCRIDSHHEVVIQENQRIVECPMKRR